VAGPHARSRNASDCAAASAPVAAASTVSHAWVPGAAPLASLAWARMAGQAGSLLALLRFTQRPQAERPGSTSGPTTPIASSASTSRCGTRSLVSAVRSTGSGRPAMTARSGTRRTSSAVRTSGATRLTAQATPAALPDPTSAVPMPAGVTSAATAVPLSRQLTQATPDAARNVAMQAPTRPAP
jgi:hypothetical protein